MAALLAVGSAGCGARDPKRELAVEGLETYWAIARSLGDTHYLAPVVRFQLRAIGELSVEHGGDAEKLTYITRVFVKRQGVWQLSHHQATVLPTPKPTAAKAPAAAAKK